MARRPGSFLRAGFRAGLVAAGVMMLAALLVVVPVSVYALVSSYASVAVPAACTGDLAQATAAHHVTVPGLGDGTLVAADGPTQVVAIPGPDGRTAGGTAAVLVDGLVVVRLPVASRTVDAGIADGVLFLFDDKIGYTLDPATGRPLPRLFESDNYRGLFTSGGVEHVQTSIEATAIGLGGRPFFTTTLPFGAVVDGCLVAVPQQ
jgi:hypothetical protein